ncbi:MAG: ATP-binding protein [Actinomycetota bacterium]
MRDFFLKNETIVLFADGVVFFALGFAVWLQRRRATRLTLTSSLFFFATFAFVEALAIWGYVFVPIQKGYVDPQLIEALIVLRAVVQTVAFLFLVQFGLRVLGLRPILRRGGTLASLALWGLIVGGGAALAGKLGWTVEEWEASVTAAARYGLLLPGAVLAAVGVWRQQTELAEVGMRRIKPFAATAAGALAVYALFAGLVVDSAPWAPGGPVAADGWFDATNLPIAVVRGLIGAVLVVSVVGLLEIFEVEYAQRLEALDRARLVAEERARFGRDLHDGTIQSIYAAGLHLEAVIPTVDDHDARNELRRVVDSLNDVITGIRTYIRALRQPAPTPHGLAAGLEELVRQYTMDTGLEARFRALGLDEAGPLPDEAGEHLAQILREALSNAARHAGPCCVEVVLNLTADELDLVVADDGIGVLPELPSDGPGQGLRNMRERARRLGGRLSVRPRDSGGGLVVDVQIPLDSDVPATEPAAPRSEEVSLT